MICFSELFLRLAADFSLSLELDINYILVYAVVY